MDKMFTLDSEQKRKFDVWNCDHNCSLKKYSGAIGGRLTFCFTTTGIGVCVKVKCGCGEEIDLTDVSEW